MLIFTLSVEPNKMSLSVFLTKVEFVQKLREEFRFSLHTFSQHYAHTKKQIFMIMMWDVLRNIPGKLFESKVRCHP